VTGQKTNKSQIEQMYPSPEPEGETEVSDKPAFVSACMAVTSADATTLGWQLGKSTLTQSGVWGLIWRIDFKARFHPASSNWINRRICWGTEDGEVLGTATVFGKKPL
jgi:hypothetical protein